MSERLAPLAPADAPGLHRRGEHRRDGVLLALGPHVKRCEAAGAHIADVPATVLALLGCGIPDDFDGRVLREILTDDVPEVEPEPDDDV